MTDEASKLLQGGQAGRLDVAQFAAELDRRLYEHQISPELSTESAQAIQTMRWVSAELLREMTKIGLEMCGPPPKVLCCPGCYPDRGHSFRGLCGYCAAEFARWSRSRAGRLLGARSEATIPGELIQEPGSYTIKFDSSHPDAVDDVRGALARGDPVVFGQSSEGEGEE